MSNHQKILSLSFFNAITRLLLVGIEMFIGIYFFSISLTGLQIGILFAANTVTSLLTILPTGFGNDSHKSKNIINLGLLILGLQFLALATIKDFKILLPLFLLGGIGRSFYTTSIDSLFFKVSKKDKIFKKIGIFQGLNFISIGLGMFIAAQLRFHEFSFEYIFTGIGISFAILAIIGHFILPNNETTKFQIIHYKKDLIRPKVIFLIVIVFLFSIHFGAERTSYGLFLIEELKLNYQQLGIYMGSATIFMAITTYLLSIKAKNWKIKNILYFGLIASGLGHILMTTKNPLLSFLFRSIHEIGDAAMFFFMFYGISKLFEHDRIGGNTGIFKFIVTVGLSAGALITGPLGETYNYGVPLAISGIIILLAYIISLKFHHLIEH